MTRGAARAHYEQFFSMSLDLLCVANAEGYFVDVNTAFWETFGWTRAEMLERPFIEFVHPDDVQSTLAEAAKLAEGYETVEFQNRYRTKHDGWLWLDWTCRPDPSTGLLYAVARNITARKEREAAEAAERQSQLETLEAAIGARELELAGREAAYRALVKTTDVAIEESESRYRSLVERSPDGMAITDVESGTLTYVNPALCAMLGAGDQAFIGEPATVMHPAVDHERVRALLEACASGRRTFDFDVPCLRQDGTVVLTDLRTSVVYFDGRRHVLSIFRNNSDRHDYEAKLGRLSSALEQSPVGVMVTDRSAVTEYVNARYTEITGLAADAVIGSKAHILEVLPGGWRSEVWSCLSDGRPWRGEYVNRRPGGESYWEETSISPFCDADGEITHFVGIVQDVTDRHEAASALRAARQAADSANQSKAEFLARLSREIQAPMKAVIGMGQLLRASELDHTQSHCVDRIDAAARSLLALIADVVSFSEDEAERDALARNDSRPA